MNPTPCFWITKGDDGIWRRADGQEGAWPHPTMAPVGALYDAPWLRERPGDFYQPGCEPKTYADGLTVVAITPDGAWVIDGAGCSRSRGQYPCPWTRSGDPRRPETFSVQPSINMQDEQTGRGFHEWLTNGVLRDA